MRVSKLLAVASVAAAAALAAPAAHADGTEALGTPSIAIADQTDALFAGVGTQQHPDTPATLNVSVPASATVKQVIAYWSGEYTWPGHGPFDGGDAQIILGGQPVTGTLIGGPTNPFLREQFETYRADVTSLGVVSAGANAISVAGMNFQTELFGPTGNKGVGLVVIYDDGSGSRVAGLRDGQDYAWAGFASPHDTTVAQTFSFASAATARQGMLGLLAAEVLDHGFAGVQGNVVTGEFDTGQDFSLVNELQSTEGLEFDARNVPVTIPAGASSLTVRILSQGGDVPASLLWIVGALTVDGVAPPPPPPPASQGCTPGYWKNHTGSWPVTGYAPSQQLSSVFSPAGLGGLGSSSLLTALSFGGGSTLEAKKRILLRAAVASLLNASHPAVDFGGAPADVISAVDDALTSGSAATVLALADALDRANRQGCLLN